MSIGSLEYVVIGVEGSQFTSKILPELNAVLEEDLIRVVDLVFVTKAEDGQVTLREVSELEEGELASYEGLAGNLLGLLTPEDVDQLARSLPAETSAVILLLEHTWALRLAEAVRQAGGTLFTGGMVTPEALQQVSRELTAKEENYA